MITELKNIDEINQISQSNIVKKNRLDDSLFSKELAPHYMKLAAQLASSELVPKSFRGKPQDLFICWAMGYQVGLTPEQSMQCISVINGKPAMWGDDMLALCMSHKDFDDIIEEPMLKDNMIIGYKCIVKRKDRADKINIFTLDMAKKAGLLAKGGVWIQYPERMLKLRARGFCLRDAFPDALKGIKPREEVEDYIDLDYTVTEQKGSRTQQLKQEILSHKGEKNEGLDCRSLANDQNKFDSKDVTQNEKHHNETSITDQKIDLYSEIKRLITEKQFTPERLEKALFYYEVISIDELSENDMQDFYNKLMKL
jgi:hypothetical protein